MEDNKATHELAFKTLLTPSSWLRTGPGAYPCEAIRHSSAISDLGQNIENSNAEPLLTLYKSYPHTTNSPILKSQQYTISHKSKKYIFWGPGKNKSGYLQIVGRICFIQLFLPWKSLFERKASVALTGPLKGIQAGVC